MELVKCQTLLALCALMSIVFDEETIAAKTSSTTALTAAEVHVGHAHKNMAAYANQTREKEQQQQQQQRVSHEIRLSIEQSHHERRPELSSYRYASNIKSNSNVNGDDGSNTGSNSDTASAAHLYETLGAPLKKSKTRRSYNKNAHHDDPATTATFNDLANLPTGLQHISDSYGNAHHATFAPLSMITGRMVRDQIPIYEEQQENDYDHSAVAAAAAAAAGASVDAKSTAEATIETTEYASENNQHQHQHQHRISGGSSGGRYDDYDGNGGGGTDDSPLRTAIYNLRAAGTHTGFLPSYDSGSSSFTATNNNNYPYGKYYEAAQQIAPAPQETHNFNDKISADGNFLHHYEHNSGYDELSASDTYQQQQQQQQQHLQQLQLQQYDLQRQQEHHNQQQLEEEWQRQRQHHHSPYLTTHGNDALSEALDNAPPSHENFDPPQSNYLHEQNTHHPPDVINYIPYPVVKKLHVPVHQPVQIPVSHAMIMPVSRPVPIHIPVPQQVQIPIEKELRIPVERVVPYPVEKNVPVPVEKRVPYPVVKYVPVKVPRPFPVKVPVFKTILHKIKGWW